MRLKFLKYRSTLSDDVHAGKTDRDFCDFRGWLQHFIAPLSKKFNSVGCGSWLTVPKEQLVMTFDRYILYRHMADVGTQSIDLPKYVSSSR